MKNLISRFVKDESGATAIEYGLIAAGISLAIIAVVNGPRHQPEHQVHLDQQLAEIATAAGKRQKASVLPRPLLSARL